MKLVLSVVISLLLLTSVSCAMNFNDLQNYVKIYNNKIGNASPLIKDILGNEKVDFTITLKNNSSMRWGMEMENAMIVRSGYSGLQNPTIVVHATEDAINNIINATDPVEVYSKAEKSGQISIECKTLTSQIKVSAALKVGDAIKPFLNSLRTNQASIRS